LPVSGIPHSKYPLWQGISRRAYKARDSRSRRDLMSSSSVVVFSLLRMTVLSSLISTVYVFCSQFRGAHRWRSYPCGLYYAVRVWQRWSTCLKTPLSTSCRYGYSGLPPCWYLSHATKSALLRFSTWTKLTQSLFTPFPGPLALRPGHPFFRIGNCNAEIVDEGYPRKTKRFKIVSRSIVRC
jgi:hypothetical protein